MNHNVSPLAKRKFRFLIKAGFKTSDYIGSDWKHSLQRSPNLVLGLSHPATMYSNMYAVMLYSDGAHVMTEDLKEELGFTWLWINTILNNMDRKSGKSEQN